jgi:D-inositol-3-phosphate glycosyltransferase
VARRSPLAKLSRRTGPAAAFDGAHDAPPRPPVAGFHGWALAERGIDRVELTLDNGTETRARLFASPRPDLAAREREPSAPLAGWEAAVELDGLEPGSVFTVAASAVAAGERLPLGELELEVAERDPLPAGDPSWLELLAERAARAPAPALDEGELRVAVFTHQLDLGGAQLYLQELLRQLVDVPNLTCTVFAQVDGPLAAELERWGVRVHITGQEPRRGSIYESRMSELLPFVGAFRPNVALVNTSVAFWGVDVAARLGLPSIWTIHESVPVEHYPQMVWPPFDEHVHGRFIAALASADRVVFEAEATHDLYRDYLTEGAAVRSAYGIDLAAVDAERRKLDRESLRAGLGIDPGERVILCMGTIEPRKAQASLAFAFARLAHEHPASRLVLVGDPGSEYARALRAAVARMTLPPGRIEIVPVSARTSEWYEIADVFALPSDLESMPRSILEAMAFELPVLAADAFGITEIVADRVNGLVCEPRCLESLTATLRRLLALSRAELAGLGSGASETVRPARDSSGYARAYLALLEELTGERRRALSTAAEPAA